jgi:MtN3 and saliva related transmembrane protein
MQLITVLGLVAAFCTTVSFVPQVIKIWETKETKDLSLVMYLILCTGLLLWAIYGFILNDISIILANTFTLLLALIVLTMKLKYG